MNNRLRTILCALGVGVVLCPAPSNAPACCPVGRMGSHVVNADQAVIIIWDAATQTQHFIRRASFKSDAPDFGFLIPSPTEPELSESGNAAFPLLESITAPEVVHRKRSSGIGCGVAKNASYTVVSSDIGVNVLQEKRVAGFDVKVLEATSAAELVAWLADHGYEFSPAVEKWAEPYVAGGWKITALKIAPQSDKPDGGKIAADALRMTFKTNRPLFPYREPESTKAANALNQRDRLLRIYFLADARYRGDLTKTQPWSGTVAWTNPLAAAQRNDLLGLLNLPHTTGPAAFWLTEFEDRWAYQPAPADVYFAKDADQSTRKRPPNVIYVDSNWPTDVTVFALAAVVVVPLVLNRVFRRRRSA